MRSPQSPASARAAAIRTESSGSRNSGEIASGASSRLTAAMVAAVSARTAGDPSRAALPSAAQASSSDLRTFASALTASARCLALVDVNRAIARSRSFDPQAANVNASSRTRFISAAVPDSGVLRAAAGRVRAFGRAA